MVDPAADALSLPEDWPAHPDQSLSLNRMGSFDWDLDAGLMHMDEVALDVFQLDPDEYDGRPSSLSRRVPPSEAVRLDGMVTQALKSGRSHYGAYFRIRTRDGSLRWTHTQGFIRRDASGRPHRIIGIVRDATQELAEATARLEVDVERRRLTSVVESTTAALAHARTVQDVIDVLQATPTDWSTWAPPASSWVCSKPAASTSWPTAPTARSLPGTRYTRWRSRTR